MKRVGIISDTHGLLRPQAAAFLQGCDRIIHAGDICSAEVLDALSNIAPVTAVRGNNDRGQWSQCLAETQSVRIGAATLYVIHDVSKLDIEPRREGVNAVIFGHSHKPRLERHDSVLYLNPGSAGPRRFSLPVSVAELLVDGGRLEPRIVELSLR